MQADEHFEALKRIPRRICVKRGHGPVMTRPHRLKHFDSFAGADLAQNNPVWSHAKDIAQKIPCSDFRRSIR